MTHPGDKTAAIVDRLRAAAQTDEGDAYDVCNLAAAEIERLTAENERLAAGRDAAIRALADSRFPPATRINDAIAILSRCGVTQQLTPQKE